MRVEGLPHPFMSLPQPADDMGVSVSFRFLQPSPWQCPLPHTERSIVLIALDPSVYVAHLRVGKGFPLACTNSWHMIGAMGEERLLYGEPGTERGQARFPQTSLKVHLQKPMDLPLATSISLGIASSLCRPLREIIIQVTAIGLGLFPLLSQGPPERPS